MLTSMCVFSREAHVLQANMFGASWDPPRRPRANEVQHRVGCGGRFRLLCRGADVDDDEDTLEILDGDQLVVEALP